MNPGTSEALPPMTSTELGETLAHLVWEGFSDDLTDGEILQLLRAPGNDGDGSAERELLVFHLWVHTRAAQLGFLERSGRPPLSEVLDNLHRAVFEDMVDNGTPRSHLKAFEQHLSGRYEEYYVAAQISDEHLARAVVRNLGGEEGLERSEAVRLIHERAIELSRPLRDFLEEIELISEG